MIDILPIAILLGIVAVSFGYLLYESIMIWRIKND